jgi:hypothetical protein
MAVTAQVFLQVQYSGDVNGVQVPTVAITNSSPGQIDLTNLVMGANTITLPTGAKGVFIWPPILNNVAITFKGIAGDTGVLMHPTDAAYFALGSGVVNFVLNAASAVTGVRFIWV